MCGKHLLIVEDEAPLRELLVECFSECGFEVTEAVDGDHAVTMLDDIDLLITDIDMPGRLDGNAIAMKAKDRHPDLPVIYASGRPDRLTNSVGQCDAFMNKPFSLSHMVALVLRLLEPWNQTRHHTSPHAL